jgi:uncharacterized membrane protein
VSTPQRYQFLDLYRGLIVLFMLEGHVVRALLQPAFQATPAFELHEIFHGITAPGFLFGAGFTFAIATQRKWDELSAWSAGLLRRLWRMVLLVAIGYLLHIPYFSLRKTIAESTPEQWDTVLAFDVLQCIGVTLFFLRLLFVIVRSETMFLSVVAALLAVIVAGTPLVWEPASTESLPRWLAMAVHGRQGSVFPLFPYAAFIFAGVLVSWEFLRFAERGNEAKFMKLLAFSGVGLVVSGSVWDILPYQLYPSYDFWFTSPAYVLIRLGILVLLLAGLWFFEAHVRHRERHDLWMPRWLITLGVESLFVYIVHLVILYGWVVNADQNLEEWWGLRLTLGESILVFIALTLVLALAARLWHYAKKRHPILMQGVYWWLGLVVVWELVSRPY